MIWAKLGLLLVAAGALVYWLVVISEGAYLGDRVVISLYERDAARYDAIKEVRAHEDGIHLARPLLDGLNAAAGPHSEGEARMLVLDVATGTGRLPAALLRQLDFDGHVVGLDASGRMLAIAQSKMRGHTDRVAWIREDAVVLPFRDHSFHAVSCLEALEILPNAVGALREMMRVLRPGGQLLLSNRVGVDALFLPGRAFRPAALEKKLRSLGLTGVQTRRWQTHYDLIDARKPPSSAGGGDVGFAS